MQIFTLRNSTARLQLVPLLIARNHYHRKWAHIDAEHQQAQQIVKHIAIHRLELLTYEYISKGCREPNVLLGILKPYAKRALTLETLRNKLLIRVVEVLEREGVDYVVFKTLNPSRAIGVDIDLLIDARQYWKTVKALIKAGFRPIDKLEKTYATGFVMPGNPIIIDLHTDITIGGVSYINPRNLLENKKKTIIKVDGAESVVYILEPCLDAYTRALHAMIKEGEMKIHNAYDIAVQLKLCRNLAKLKDLENWSQARKTIMTSVIIMNDEKLAKQLIEVEKENTLGDLIINRFVQSLIDEGVCKMDTGTYIINVVQGVIKMHGIKGLLEMSTNILKYSRNIVQMFKKFSS